MDFDPLLLSRMQFAFTVSFHIIFPGFTIGLAAWLVTLEGLSLATGRAVYATLFRFWVKVFAVTFGMGVVSGIVMAFQFGTNWSELSARAGPIQGPLLGYEVYTAFLLEGTFLGVLLFGRKRVPRWAYFVSCFFVALGTTMSAYWIMANNSWMQFPMGFLDDGHRFVPVDWTVILSNGVYWTRFLHMLLAAYLTTAFCIAATGAWYMLRRIHPECARTMLNMGLGLAAVLIPLQIALGHISGENTAKYQPSKFTTIEGRWQTEEPARLLLFAWPDTENERNTFEVAIPVIGSFVIDGTFSSSQPGIVTVPRDQRPPYLIPFYSFRIMVGIGLLMMVLSWGGLWLARKGWEGVPRALLWSIFLSFPLGFIAILTGWFTAEVGRQPWVIYGLVRTADALTPSLTAHHAWFSLISFVVVYALIFSAGTVYIYRLLREGPDELPVEPDEVSALRPMAAAGPGPGMRTVKLAPGHPGAKE